MQRFLRLLAYLSRPLVSWFGWRGLLAGAFRRRPLSRYEWCARPCLERLEELAGGAGLYYSALYGGSGTDQATGVAAANSAVGSNVLYVSGLTSSSNFPIASAFQGTYGGGTSDAVMMEVAQPAPIAVNDSLNMVHDATLSVPAAMGVLANDVSQGGLPLTAVQVTGPAHGTLTLNSDGSFVYTPTAGWTGSVSFTYKATDGVQTSGTATVSVMVVDTTPGTQADSYTLLHDQAFTVTASSGVLANDHDADNDTLTAQLATGPTHGTLTLNSDGSFTYTPNAGYTGSDAFTFRASDGTQSSANTTANLKVVDTAPQAFPAGYQTEENNTISQAAGTGVLAGAFDAEGDPMKAVLVSGPAHGTLTLQTNGAFTYVPVSNYYGTDSFTYEASDGLLVSAPQTVTINVDQAWTVSGSGASPSAVAVGDFNGDGNSDIAVTDQGQNKVYVYLANSSGAFGSATSTITVGTAPDAIVSADFNGDGKTDLTVANSGSNTISILFGNGDGTFTAGPTLTTGTTPSALVVGDFNGDGKPDLAVANKGSNTVTIYLNNGNGTFSPGPVPTTGSQPDGLAVADLNGDGKTDLIVSNGGGNTDSSR